ncbi:hypothetical protein ACFLXY_09530 [Chloroflexota bacterium]
MEESKYRKYFLNELTPDERQKGFGKMPAMVVFTDDDIIKGSNYFSVMIMGEQATKGYGHGPHTHRDSEVLVALGTDMDNPRKLNAVMEICMGPEMESHIITESTIVYIPPEFIHCPFRILSVERPFIFIQAQYAGKLTETSLKKMVAEELRDKMIFIDADGSSEE